MSFESEDKIIALVNSRLEEILSPQTAKYSEIVYEAMRYSIFAGGKRLRPLLLAATYQAAGGNSDENFSCAIDFACAIEMIHCYSLIHDDLPAMDDDDFRRGKPTNHKLYGEAIAILAGNALLTKAFEVMAAHAVRSNRAARAMLRVAQASGADGMIGGQTADITYEGKQADANVLAYIHEHKTGALFCASAAAGAIFTGADEDVLDALDKCMYKLGISFQIKDDIFDLTSTDDNLGKPTGSDEKNDKLTYPAIFGLEKAQADFDRLSAEAFSEAKALFGAAAAPLTELMTRITGRIN